MSKALCVSEGAGNRGKGSNLEMERGSLLQSEQEQKGLEVPDPCRGPFSKLELAGAISVLMECAS